MLSALREEALTTSAPLHEVRRNLAAYLAATGDLAAAVEAPRECVGMLANRTAW